MTEDGEVVRIGVLGAASIAAEALVRPAARRTDVEVVAIAARRPRAAGAFAEKHGIARAFEHYERVVEDPLIDLVYIALAASHHAEWALAALRAGKHVLVEKPATTNVEDAHRLIAGTGAARLVEAFHYRYHPLFRQVLALVRSGRLGPLRSLTAELRDPRPFDPRSVLHDPAVGGGVLLHAGCYPAHWMRTLAGSEPTVVSASAVRNPLGADETIEAELAFPDGVDASLFASFGPGGRVGNRLTVVGERGRVDIENLVAPHAGHSVRLDIVGEPQRTFTVAGDTSYDHQLEAVVSALRSGEPLPTEGEDIVANAVAIDAIHDAAGLSARRG